MWTDRAKLTEGYAQAAIHLMDHAHRKGKPFYVNLWLDDVHSPFFPAKEARGNGSKRDLYLGVLKGMDAQLGKILNHIRQTPSLRNNTIILVCSDNGHEPGAGQSSPLKGCKGNLYEGGIRSPLIVWGPGYQMPAMIGKSNVTSVFSAIDLSASLRAIMDENSGELHSDQLDGENLIATLLGRSLKSREKPIFWRRPPDRKQMKAMGPGPLPDLAMREESWKLLCQFDGSKPQLYQIEEDPSEEHNLASQFPDRVESMKKILLEWHQAMPNDRSVD